MIAVEDAFSRHTLDLPRTFLYLIFGFIPIGLITMHVWCLDGVKRKHLPPQDTQVFVKECEEQVVI